MATRKRTTTKKKEIVLEPFMEDSLTISEQQPCFAVIGAVRDEAKRRMNEFISWCSANDLPAMAYICVQSTKETTTDGFVYNVPEDTTPEEVMWLLLFNAVISARDSVLPLFTIARKALQVFMRSILKFLFEDNWSLDWKPDTLSLREKVCMVVEFVTDKKGEKDGGQ